MRGLRWLTWPLLSGAALISVTAFALVSLMFFLMARMNDPMLPRAMFGVLNTVLYFPSGAVYPQQGFPGWMQVIAKIDPFTYAVHAFKSLLLKNTGWEAISYDIGYLVVFSAVAMTSPLAASWMRVKKCSRLASEERSWSVV